MWETNSRFLTQLSFVEIYAYIGIRKLDLNAWNPAMNDYVLASLTCIEHLYGPNDPISLFDLYPIIVNTFSPSSIDVQQYGGLNNYHTLKPDSSKQTTWSIMPPSPPRLIEDIMDDIRSDEECNDLLAKDFNMGDHDDENDTNDDNDVG